MPKTLLILRHAKSSWDHPDLNDHDRPLNKRGRRDAPRMGQLIRQQGLLPDLILSSTAQRAKETAEAVIQECGYRGAVNYLPSFYAAGPRAILAALRELPDAIQCVMVVGHNPDLEELLESLTGNFTTLSTCALAQVILPVVTWKDVLPGCKGNLAHLWLPRELD
jgi:phosphohistidine phosphatase